MQLLPLLPIVYCEATVVAVAVVFVVVAIELISQEGNDQQQTTAIADSHKRPSTTITSFLIGSWLAEPTTAATTATATTTVTAAIRLTVVGQHQ